MSQRAKVGNVYVELPKGIETATPLAPKAGKLLPEKPEEPEPLEEPQYIYRPNDPFRAAIDEARAVASITSAHKPWVKAAWFAIFVMGPLLYIELYALSSALGETGLQAWRVFFTINLTFFPVWLLYLAIWRRKVRRKQRTPE
ncbi:MAG TPA: hypothetical protein VN028_01935 [Rhodocyclaceae bacterium]|nr:hypothetical protein [Rhodocyclaceae bacterium]